MRSFTVTTTSAATAATHGSHTTVTSIDRAEPQNRSTIVVPTITTESFDGGHSSRTLSAMPPASAWQWSSERWTPAPTDANTNATLTDIDESASTMFCSADDDHHPLESISSYGAQSNVTPRIPLAQLFDHPACTSTEGGNGESHPIGKRSNEHDARGLTNQCYDVFLGGSCGRTTWRQEDVMPVLARYGIRYYNPQVDLWTPQLIAKEEHAKQNSEYLLFVLDPSTVNAATFVEIPYLIAKGAKLVIVHLHQDSWLCNGHKCDRTDRIRLIAFLRSIVAHHNIPMFTSVDDGLQYLLRQLVRRMCPLTAVYHRDTRQLYKEVQMERLRKWMTKERISMVNVQAKCKAVLDLLHSCLIPSPSSADLPRTTLLTCEGIAATGLYALLCSPVTPLTSVSPSSLLMTLLVAHTGLTLALKWNGHTLTAKQRRDRYARVIMDMRRSSIPVRRRLTMDLSPNLSFSHRPLLWRSGSVHNRVQSSSHFDLYVGGSGGEADLEWLPRVAYPLLHAHNISYADMNMYGEFVQRAALLPQCKTIVYHMSSPLSALSGLAECAYLMGLYGSRVVASIPPWCINVMVCECYCQSTERTIGVRNRCYHRAFEYVRDIALRNQCNLFKRAEDALHHAITTTAKRKRNPSASFNARSPLLCNNNNTIVVSKSDDRRSSMSSSDSEDEREGRRSDTHRASLEGLPTSSSDGHLRRPAVQFMHSLSTT